MASQILPPAIPAAPEESLQPEPVPQLPLTRTSSQIVCFFLQLKMFFGVLFICFNELIFKYQKLSAKSLEF